MSDINNELRSKLFEIIEPAIFNNSDKIYLDKTLDNLQDLIDKVVREARIEEASAMIQTFIGSPNNMDDAFKNLQAYRDKLQKGTE